MATGLAIGGSGGGGSMVLLKYAGFGLLDKLWTCKNMEKIFFKVDTMCRLDFLVQWNMVAY